VAQFSKKKGPLLPENALVNPGVVVRLQPGLKSGKVREWAGK
jgi:hypothetical protein